MDSGQEKVSSGNAGNRGVEILFVQWCSFLRITNSAYLWTVIIGDEAAKSKQLSPRREVAD